MKQYLRFLSTPEINNTLLKDILTKRFPTYDVYIKNGATYVRKNAIVKAKVKIKEQETESAITVNMVQPWWVWLLIGWLIYAFYKRGFTDEVYSVLRKDLAIKFPFKFAHLLSPAELANWKLKTKPLGTIGILLLCLELLYPIVNYVLPFIFNCCTGENLWQTNYMIWIQILILSLPGGILWFALGYVFMRLPNIGIGKIAGYILISYSGLRFLNIIFNILAIININVPETYYKFTGILFPFILILSGILIQKSMQTGPSKYFCFTMVMNGILSFAQFLSNKSIISYYLNWDYDLTTRSIVYYSWIWLFIVFYIILDFFLARSLYKMKKYPIERLPKSGCENTTV